MAGTCQSGRAPTVSLTYNFGFWFQAETYRKWLSRLSSPQGSLHLVSITLQTLRIASCPLIVHHQRFSVLSARAVILIPVIISAPKHTFLDIVPEN